MSDDKPENEIISFKNASEPHINARKDRKLKEVQKAFKALIRKKLKQDRAEAGKKSKKKGKKK